MAIPFATKNELKALDDKITAAEQTPVASVRNIAPIYKHTIVMSGVGEVVKSENITVILYSTINETLTAGPVDKQEVITKVLNNIIRYESIECEIDPEAGVDVLLPLGFGISSMFVNNIAFILAYRFDMFSEAFQITNIISDTVGE